MNFIVWRRGLRGPEASLDLMDPRQSMDWKLHEQRMIAIFPLNGVEREFSLASLMVIYPCPEHAEL